MRVVVALLLSVCCACRCACLSLLLHPVTARRTMSFRQGDPDTGTHKSVREKARRGAPRPRARPASHARHLISPRRGPRKPSASKRTSRRRTEEPQTNVLSTDVLTPTTRFEVGRASSNDRCQPHPQLRSPRPSVFPTSHAAVARNKDACHSVVAASCPAPAGPGSRAHTRVCCAPLHTLPPPSTLADQRSTRQGSGGARAPL